MNPLLSALSTAGDVLDMPGSYLRGALSGRPGERASGREMLQNWGVAGENQPGLDWGDVGGFGAEMVLDPLSLAAPALGAFKGLRGIQAGTRAAQALSHSDDANPLVKAMAGFAGDEGGYLKFRIPGVSDEMHNMMDAVGPRYPGGTQKLLGEIGNQPLFGSTPDIMGKSVADRLEEIAGSPHGRQVASELPLGSQFLGAGQEAIAFRSPEGSVIRIGDDPTQGVRPQVPEMLQAFRETRAGPYTVEHLPEIATVHNEFYQPFNKLFHQNIPGYDDAKYAEHLMREGNFDALKHLQDAVERSGLYPWDVTAHNIGMTQEGLPIVFDRTAIAGAGQRGATFGHLTPEQARALDAADPRLAPKPSYPIPGRSDLRSVLTAGGPEKVRESLRQGIHMGTVGQGIATPRMKEIADNRELVQRFMEQHGYNPGLKFGWRD